MRNGVDVGKIYFCDNLSEDRESQLFRFHCISDVV
jgi:hypothetical protein